MIFSLSKFLFLLFIIYLVRMVFRVISTAPAGQRRSAGRSWRDAVRNQPGAAAQAPSWAVDRQNVALDLVQCKRCGAYVPPKTACDRADCPSR